MKCELTVGRPFELLDHPRDGKRILGYQFAVNECSVNYIDKPVRIFMHNLQYLIRAVCTEQLLAFQVATNPIPSGLLLSTD